MMNTYRENGMPLRKGKVNLVAEATGLVDGLFECVEDGAITVTWKAGGTDTINFLAGNVRVFIDSSSIEIDSGVFHTDG